MEAFAPKFCPIHLKIHVCPEQNVTKKLSEIENDLGAKVRRLHGIQTEEEIAAELAKQKDAPGTFGDIIAKAKANAAKQKEKIKSSGHDDLEGKVVSEAEVGDRMAALRARMGGGTSQIDSPQPAPSPTHSPGGLGEVIQNAKQHQADNTNAQFKVPELSNIGETVSTTINEDYNHLDALNEPDFAETTQVSSKKVLNGKKIAPITTHGESTKVFSVEETQQLIQEAVKEALIQVGIAKKPRTTTKKTTTSVKKPASTDKKTSSSKTPSSTTSKKPASTEAKKTASTTSAKKTSSSNKTKT